MKIAKAVITAAHPGQRHLPLQTLVDRDGNRKSALQILIEEVVSTGIEQVALVTCPGDGPTYAEAAGPHAPKLNFVAQEAPRGYGDAVLRAAPFVGDEPFLLLVSDHLYVSADAKSCAAQLVEVAAQADCSVSAVQATHESKLGSYGAVGGHLESAQPGGRSQRGLYLVERVVEKPTPTEAEQHLMVPGLRAGFYLCFFGIHVLTPRVMRLLAEDRGERVHLSPALARLSQAERYLALELAGRRHDLDAKYGLFTAQLGLALAGHDRAEVLSQIVESLAWHRADPGSPPP